MLATITAAGTQDPIHETWHCVCYLDIKNYILVSRGSALHMTVSWNESICGQLNIHMRQGNVADSQLMCQSTGVLHSKNHHDLDVPGQTIARVPLYSGDLIYLYPPANGDAALPTVV